MAERSGDWLRQARRDLESARAMRMPTSRSVIQKQSYGSVKVFWLDRSLLMSRITRAARTLAGQHEAVVRVVLFGSVACDRAVPSSDADLLVVVRACDAPFMDRAALFREHFRDLGVGVDLFVYTEREVAAGNIPIATHALRTGIVLFPPTRAQGK